jgi:hypothetical protein
MPRQMTTEWPRIVFARSVSPNRQSLQSKIWQRWFRDESGWPGENAVFEDEDEDDLAGPPYAKNSSARPKTTTPTKNDITVNPITRRRLMPAIARTGSAQNG